MRWRTNGFPGKRHLALAAVLGFGVAALPTVASSETTPVEAINEGAYKGTHRWSPSQETVVAGEAITFRNTTEVPHGVEWRSALKPSCEEGAGKVPVGTSPSASGTNWSGKCTFSQAGTYTFWCTVHGAEMSGTITVNAGGTTTTTTPTTTTTTTTTTTPPPPPPEESPLAGPASQALKLAKSQHGGSVQGSIAISKAGAGGQLEVDLFAQSASLATTKRGAKRGATVRVGQLLRSSLSAGKVSFSVRLNARARRALRRRRRLSLTVKIVVTPASGKSVPLTRFVVEHA